MSRGLRSLGRALSAGWDRTIAVLTPALSDMGSAPLFERLRAVLNGVLGDRLLAAASPLAIKMELRRDGKPLELTRAGIAAAIPDASSKVLVLVHGLCMNELSWQRNGHDHGAALARDLSFTSLYLRYNSGLHISRNGRELANLMEGLLAAWPVPVDEVAIVAHSMGGLIARSAVHYGIVAGYSWPGRLRSLVFLGTPHQGVPLERIGHWLEVLWSKTIVTAPLAKVGKVRSAGITDLRHGYVLDEDWHGRDRFAPHGTVHRPLPLPTGVACYAIAAALGDSDAPLRNGWIGDGLVPVASALGLHADPSLAMGIPSTHRWTAYGAGHMDLLERADVYEQIRNWLAS
ncbi:MAG: alpha/beta hydrolase [Steroidobacteraceae bacterium]